MKYIVTSTQFNGELVFTYTNNQLVGMDIEAVSNNGTMLRFVYAALPKTSEALLGWLVGSKTMKIREVPSDLSFDNFWNTYHYKVGNKPKSEKLWKAMSDASKALALTKIKKYREAKENEGTAMLYPERYLSYKTYENEF